MRLRILIVLLIAGFFASAQNPGNYLYRQTRERLIAGMWDSTATMPAGIYPTLRGGGSGRSGALFVDSVGGGQGLHYYLSGSFRRVVDSTELADTAAAIRAIIGSGGGSGTVNTGAANRLAYYPGAGTIVDDLAAITANRALISDANGLPTHSVVTNAELGYVSGATSAIQTQLDGKQPLDADLTDIAALSPSNDDIIQRKAGAWTNRTIAQLKTDLSLSGTNTGDQTISLTGDVTGSGTGSLAATLASVISAGSCTSCNLTYDAKGRITVAANGSGGAASITVGTSVINSGTSTRVPFNDAGIYNEDAGFTYNKTTDALTLGGSLRLPDATASVAGIYLNNIPYFSNYGPTNDNFYLGKNAGSASVVATHSQNIAIGINALQNVTSQGNIAIGTEAGKAFTAATDPSADFKNIFIGHSAGLNATGGQNGIYIGSNAGQNAQNGSFSNTAVGKVALGNCTTCNANSAFGASIELTTGTWNALVGADIFTGGTSASFNAGVGAFSFAATTTGSYNAWVGYTAGGNNTTGSGNSYLGEHAFSTNTTGSYNIGIGNFAGAYNTTGSYQFVVHAENKGGISRALVGGDLQNYRAVINSREDSVKLWGATLAVIGDFRVTHVDSTASGTAQNMLYVTQEGYIKRAAVPSGGGSGITVGTTTITSGATTRIAFNDGGVYQEDDSLSWNKNTNALTVNAIRIGRGNSGEITNTAIGNGALNASTTGVNSVALGYRALFVNTTGTNTTAVGYQALAANTTGNYNTAFGASSLQNNVSGSNNTAVGIQALLQNTASSSTAVGYAALQAATSGGSNTAVGWQSGVGTTTATGVTFLGYSSGQGVTTGNYNTMIGFQSGLGVTTGSGNTVVGAQIIGLSTTLTNNIILGNGTGAIKAQHDGTDWEFTGRIGNTKTTEQMRLKYDASNYLATTVTSTGSTTIDLTGTTPVLTLADSLKLTAISQTAIDTATWKVLVKNVDNNTVKTTSWAYAGGGGSGTVTSFAATDGNGFDFSVSNATTTPTLTATTTVGNTQIFVSNSGAMSGSSALEFGSGTLFVGDLGSTTGKITLYGSTSGGIVIQPQNAAGTYNFNLPTSSGSSGQALISGGGGSTAMSWLDISSNTYTPTLTGVLNVSSTSVVADAFHYTRVGNEVTVHGILSVTPTAGSTNTQVGISLPFASDFTVIGDAPGTGTLAANGTPGIYIYADVTNNRAQIEFGSPGTSATNMSVTFQYTIK